MHQISKIYEYFVIKLYMFRASSIPIIRSYLLYPRQLVPLPSSQIGTDPARKRSHNLHETYKLPSLQ
jgi:hypothetical protein